MSDKNPDLDANHSSTSSAEDSETRDIPADEGQGVNLGARPVLSSFAPSVAAFLKKAKSCHLLSCFVREL